MTKLQKSNSKSEDEEIWHADSTPSSVSFQEPSSQPTLASKLTSSLPMNRRENASLEKILLSISLKGNPHAWAASLSDVGFSKIDASSTHLLLEHVQALDFESKPYQFVNLSISKNSLELSYSLLPSQNPIRRKLFAAHLAFLTLSSIGASEFTPSIGAFVSQCLGESSSFVLLDVDQLSAKNHELENTIKEQNDRLKELYSQREEGSRKMLLDAKKLQELSSIVEKLQAIPDSALDEEVFEWLKTHGGEISIKEFSSANSIPPSRIGISLDRLCKLGKIARVEK